MTRTAILPAVFALTMLLATAGPALADTLHAAPPAEPPADAVCIKAWHTVTGDCNPCITASHAWVALTGKQPPFACPE